MLTYLASRQVEIFSIAWLVLTFSLFLNFHQARKGRKLLKKQKLLEAEMETAHSIQQAFLTPPPQIAGYDIAARYETANSLGGDFYHFFQSPNHLGVVIGDVSGHGASSALVMALMEGILDELGVENLKPHQILENLDKHLSKFLKGGPNHVTLLVGILDLSSGRLEYASAGHPPLLHFDSTTHQTRELSSGGSMLGIFDDNQYESFSTQLNSGDSLLFYTDGLSEARNTEHEFWGEQPLHQNLKRNATTSALQTLEGLYQQVQSFSPVIQDDRAAVLIKKIQ